MKSLPVAFVVSSLLLSGASLHAQAQNYSSPVRVNGKPIISSEVRDAVRAQEYAIRMQISDPRVAESRILQVRAGALFFLMEEQLVLSEFEQAKGIIKPQYVDDEINRFIRERFNGDRTKFLQELAKAGMTLQGFREQREKAMIVGSLRLQRLKNLPPPTPAQVEAFYRKNIDKFTGKDHVKFSTITIPKFASDAAATPESQRKLAEDIRAKVTGGSDFAQMAKTHSTDAYAKSGGDRGLQERSDLSPEIADVAFDLKPGAVSKIVNTETSYMIIYCEAKQLAITEPLEKVRPLIEKMVANEMSRDEVNRWLSSLASKAVIQPESVKRDFLQWIGQQQPAVE